MAESGMLGTQAERATKERKGEGGAITMSGKDMEKGIGHAEVWREVQASISEKEWQGVWEPARVTARKRGRHEPGPTGPTNLNLA